MPSLRYKWMVGAFLLIALSAVRANAQDSQASQPTQSDQTQGQTQPAAPIPAYRSPLASATDSGDSTESGQVTPDTRALAGAENLSLGLETGHSYWQPHVDIFESADSNAQETPNGYSWGSWTSILGGVDVHHISGNTNLVLSYIGGVMISTGTGVGNGAVQQLGFTDKLVLRRWTLTFLDQLSYLPPSAFGFGGLGGTALPIGGIGGVGSAFTPGQNLLTGEGQSVANSFATEADLALTPRGSLTFVGGYSLLHYFNSDLFNSGGPIARLGYNYLLTPKDTVAVFYTYTGLRYGNADQSIDTHTIQASYARRITGRLAFQVAAGPEIALSRLPLSAGGTGTPSTNSTQLFWSLNTNVRYRLERYMLTGSYDHGVTSGSGLLAGSVTDLAGGQVSRQMSPTFSSGLQAGYSHNSGLALNGVAETSQNYNYWYVGANLTHPWGDIGLTLSYQLQYQDSNGSFCIGTICGESVIRHLISIGVGWHSGPLLFK